MSEPTQESAHATTEEQLRVLMQSFHAESVTSIYHDRHTGSMRAPSLPSELYSPKERNPAPEWSRRESPAEQAPAAPYLFSHVIGRGGFGEVWEGVQISLGRPVAVKRLKPDRLNEGDASSRARVLREFRQEAFTAARLEHPSIVPVYDLGEDESGRPMMAMKLARGKDWSNLLVEDRKKLGPDEFLSRHLPVLVSAAQGLAFAHSQGIVHRDFKPAQVVVGEFGEVLLMDWGLAVVFDHDRLTRTGALPKLDDFPTTSTASSPAGTPALMAPEQVTFSADGIGPWTDVYLLGGTLYFMLTGRYPHDSATAIASMKRALLGEVTPPQSVVLDRELPVELCAIAMKALERFPADRMASVSAFIEAIDDYMRGTTRRRESEGITGPLHAEIERAGSDYRSHNECINRLVKARELWPQNPTLKPLSEALHTSYARAALSHGDLRLSSVQVELLGPSDSRTSIEIDIASAEAEARRASRQRRAALAASALLVVVVLAVGGWYSRQLAAQRNEAIAARADADNLITFMLEDLTDDLETIGRQDLLKKPAAKAIEYLSKPSARDSDKQVLLMKSRALTQLGEVMRSQSDFNAARKAQEESLALALRVRAEDPSTSAAIVLMLTAEQRLGVVELMLGNLDACIAHIKKSVEYGDIAAAETKNPEIGFRSFSTNSNILAHSYKMQGRRKEAMDLLLETRARIDTWLMERPNDLGAVENLQALLTNLQEVQARNGEVDAAYETATAQLAAANRILATDPDNRLHREKVAFAYFSMSSSLDLLGRTEDALQAVGRANEIRRALCKEDPSNGAWHVQLSDSLALEGMLMMSATRWRDGMVPLMEATQILESEDDDSSGTVLALSVSRHYSNLSTAQTMVGDFAEAQRLAKRALEYAEMLSSERHTESERATSLRAAMNGSILAAAQAGDNALVYEFMVKREAMDAPVVEDADGLGEEEPGLATGRRVLRRAEYAVVLFRLGKADEARAVLLEAENGALPSKQSKQSIAWATRVQARVWLARAHGLLGNETRAKELELEGLADVPAWRALPYRKKLVEQQQDLYEATLLLMLGRVEEARPLVDRLREQRVVDWELWDAAAKAGLAGRD